MIIKKIDIYIIKKFLGTFIFALLLILSISVVFDFNEKVDRFIQNAAPTKEIIFDYYANFIPYFANLFSPLFTFISVIFFTSKLADNSEIIAILASGISFKRLIRPYIFSAAIIAGSSFLLNSFIIPPGNVKRLDFENKYVRNQKVDYDTNIQIEVSPNTFAYFDRYDAPSKTGFNFSMEKYKKKNLVYRMTAQTIKYDTLNRWSIENYMIRNFHGIKEKDSKGAKKNLKMNIMPSDFLISENDCEQLTTPQLKQYIDRQKNRGIGNIQLFEIEYYKRFASAFAAFILTIIGASLSSKKIKGGMGMNIGIGLGLSFSYILFMQISSSFAISGAMPAIVAIWIPNIVFTLIAAVLFERALR